MTLVTGTVQDLGYDGMEGTLWARPARFRSDGQVVLAPERKPFKITGGVVSAELAPGPAVLELQVGSHARGTFEVVIPDTDITLADLLDTVFPWEPAQVSLFVAEREAAEQAKTEAEQAATLAGTAKTGAELAAQQTGQDRTAVASDKDTVVSHVQALAEPNDAAVLGLISEGADTQTKAALNATYVTVNEGPVNPERYGAVADGTTVGGTDNLAPFQAALATAGPGGQVMVPTGRYWFSGPLVIDEPVALLCSTQGSGSGAASNSTELIFPPGVDGVRIEKHPDKPRPHGWTLGPFRILSAATETHAGQGNGLSILDGKGEAHRTRVSGFGGHGFLLQGGATYGGTNVNHTTLFMPIANGNRGNGFLIRGSDAQKMQILYPDATANHGWGIEIQGSAQNLIESPHFAQQYHGSPGAFRDAAMSTMWRNVYTESGSGTNGSRVLFDTGSVNAELTYSSYGKPTPEFVDGYVRAITYVRSGNSFLQRIRLLPATTASTHDFELDHGVHGANAVRGRLTDGTSSTVAFLAGLTNFNFGLNVNPITTDTHDLGSTTRQWRDGRFSRVVQAGSVATDSRPTPAVAGAGAMIYDSTLGKMILSNGTAWVNLDGTAL